MPLARERRRGKLALVVEASSGTYSCPPNATKSEHFRWVVLTPWRCLHATHMAGVAFGCSNRAYGECQEEPLANLAYSYRSCGGIRREGERDYNNTTDQETDRRIC